MKECDMAIPVANWLRAQGYRVYPEEMQYDFIATNGDHVVIIEMKLALTQSLCLQLSRASYHCPRTYGVIATTPRKGRNLDWLKGYGAGLLQVQEGVVRVLHECTLAKPYRPKWEQETIHRLSGKPEPTEIRAGIPQLKGEGPMQRLIPVVREYFARNPAATWKQAFSDIPNHYASHKSFGQHLAHARITSHNHERAER